MTNEIRTREILRQLRTLELVEMKAAGRWGLTPSGRDFLDQLDVLRELDDRPDTVAGRRPRAGAAAPKGTRSGDDDGPRRGARAKATR